MEEEERTVEEIPNALSPAVSDFVFPDLSENNSIDFDGLFDPHLYIGAEVELNGNGIQVPTPSPTATDNRTDSVVTPEPSSLNLQNRHNDIGERDKYIGHQIIHGLTEHSEQEIGNEFNILDPGLGDLIVESIATDSDQHQHFSFETNVLFDGSSFTTLSPAVFGTNDYELISDEILEPLPLMEATLIAAPPSSFQDDLSVSTNHVLLQTSGFDINNEFGVGESQQSVNMNTSDADIDETDEDAESSSSSSMNKSRYSRFGSSTSKSESNQEQNTANSMYIQKTNHRRNRFLKGWSALVSKISHMKTRTGATADVEAVFENKIYQMELLKQNSRIRTDSNQSNFSNSTETCGTGGDTTSETDDDHRYAAVIVTQKLSSSGVKDHQYNERNASRSKSYVQNDSEPSKSNLRTASYLNVRYTREKQLVSFIGVLFSKIKTLEARTGCTVKLKISYESFIFTKENYKDADAVLKSNRGSHLVSKVSTVPTTMSITNESQQQQPVVLSVDRTPLPEGVPSKVQVKFVWKDESPQPIWLQRLSTLTSANDNQETPAAVPQTNDYQDLIKIPDHHSSVSDSVSNHLSSDICDVDEGSRSGESDMTYMSGPPSVSASIVMLRSPQEEGKNNETAFSSSSAIFENNTVGFEPHIRSNSETNKCTKNTSMKDAGTTTDPICQICNSSIPSSTSARPFSMETMWIRCFNPLCQYLVHPSCIGFRVMSSEHLNMLPPYFCDAHR